ncbi:MurR/RpiR family transcriptional regulator [Gryllotalpicola sp.]|uniref:MurR/RpiR family transcriptional regulator n=1 Tax=Gryllotalpicola sp. TaxID=1932787 RepID=UPI0026306000|nr:MurR/RpiR family transcriptional regulator [Gryllotalpicola sp.]
MTVNDEIFARIGELSPAEKKVARALLSSYPSSGLGSAATLAKSAGTSTPTVLRLIARLGFGSYPDFQRRLREEITHHMSSPVSRTEQSHLEPTESGLFQDAINDKIALVEALSGSVPPSEFDHAVQVLAARPRHVTVSGGYFTRYFAMLFASQLDQVIPNVDYIQEPFGHDVGRFLRLTSGSVAIILDFRRYELASKVTAEAAKAQGASVIVITDQELSPAADSADIVLPVTVGGVPFDSVVGLVVLLEALLEGIVLATGERGIARMKQWEDSAHIARAYSRSADIDLTK